MDFRDEQQCIMTLTIKRTPPKRILRKASTVILTTYHHGKSGIKDANEGTPSSDTMTNRNDIASPVVDRVELVGDK